LADFQNPQQEPGGDKRILLAFLVIALVLIPLMRKFAPQAPTSPSPTSSAPAQSTSPPPLAASTPPIVRSPGITRQAASETETVIENDLYRITFTNRGAQVKSWILKKFDNDAQNGPLDLVNPAAAQKYGYPLSLFTYDESLRYRLSDALYVASTEGQISAPAQITFEYSDQDLTVRKTFGFDHTYLVKVETSGAYKGAEISVLPMWPSGFGDQVTPASYTLSLIDYHNDASTDHTALVFPSFTTRLAIKSISGGKTVDGPFEWAGPVDQYFAAVFIPDDPTNAAMVTLRNSIPVPQKPDSKETVNVEVLGAAVGSLRGPTAERVYVGPKELAVLEAIRVPAIKTDNPDLRSVVDFGWWGLIARPLFLWLKWTYNHIVPNWGWAIVLQTLIISVALLPLRIYQIHSMYKMQRVAPQIKAIQEKYKKYSMTDPRKAKMNEEVAALYKQEGANPAGGCLPMLIQFPFLIAYYRMLGVALDLRHAHWLWIHDLSVRDPYLVLPIFMVLTMLITQKMTPQAGMDPAQQKMMTWMMPLMMGVIFYNLAAGLNLYYAESNLIMIAQQALMNRTKAGREMRELMEKRARKKEK
jgi:YidC/Oxa1 family membrane protein insertase